MTVIEALRWPDIPVLVALDAQLFSDDQWSALTWWAELAARPRREYVVAREEGQIVGYAGLDHGGEVADVMTVAVAPPGQGRGIGRMLLGEMEERAAGRGAQSVMLEVRADNAPALALYHRAGYTHVRTRRRYYQPGDVDALVLRKPLAATSGTRVSS